jgi:stage III sporulation protein AG
LGKFLQKIEQWVGGGPGGTKRINTFRWLLLIGLVGISFMILNSFLHVEQVGSLEENKASPPQNNQEVFMNEDKEQSPFGAYEEKYETRIKEILEKMVGVGGVEVMVNIESTEEIIVYKNHRDTQSKTNEKDRNGAVRQITEVSRNGEIVLHEVSGNQSPIILKTIKPQIRGVVIVANGAENITVKTMILEAVRKGLAVPPHRISIAPRKQK